MARLAIEAHCVDDEFRAYLNFAGITIVDETNAPWEWVFEGSRAALRAALATHWHILGKTAEAHITGD